jgi:dCTP deaminase
MDNWRPGVLNKKQLIELCNKNIIRGVNTATIEDPSSIDLHITDNPVYVLKGCVKPKRDQDISHLCDRFKNNTLSFEKDGTISLEKRKSYIFKVNESINFKGNQFYGQATGKSTFGRLDILTRLLTSHSDTYDFIGNEYQGSLWVEVTPITFPIKIKKGMSLNQLRVYKGELQSCCITNDSLGLWGDLIFDEDGKKITEPTKIDNLTLNLKEDPNYGKGICAFAVKKNIENLYPEQLDLTINIDNGEYIDANKYWEKIVPTIDDALEIEPERFFILRSRERFKLPESVAIYCQAVTENLGELRIHYAGFAHPCFGTDRPDGKGAPLIFEVRGHNIKACLQHGETLAKLGYYYMSQDANPKDCKSSYHQQELTLSKYFKFS